ncbi:hypothetical protein CDIK_0336 [Cucumispora dikerogammari]|nr:hypothetical protein CDIK_0336 [Cucumispora dikerogammari]
MYLLIINIHTILTKMFSQISVIANIDNESLFLNPEFKLEDKEYWFTFIQDDDLNSKTTQANVYTKEDLEVDINAMTSHDKHNVTKEEEESEMNEDGKKVYDTKNDKDTNKNNDVKKIDVAKTGDKTHGNKQETQAEEAEKKSENKHGAAARWEIISINSEEQTGMIKVGEKCLQVDPEQRAVTADTCSMPGAPLKENFIFKISIKPAETISTLPKLFSNGSSNVDMDIDAQEVSEIDSELTTVNKQEKKNAEIKNKDIEKTKNQKINNTHDSSKSSSGKENIQKPDIEAKSEELENVHDISDTNQDKTEKQQQLDDKTSEKYLQITNEKTNEIEELPIEVKTIDSSDLGKTEIPVIKSIAKKNPITNDNVEEKQHKIKPAYKKRKFAQTISTDDEELKTSNKHRKQPKLKTRGPYEESTTNDSTTESLNNEIDVDEDSKTLQRSPGSHITTTPDEESTFYQPSTHQSNNTRGKGRAPKRLKTSHQHTKSKNRLSPSKTDKNKNKTKPHNLPHETPHKKTSTKKRYKKNDVSEELETDKEEGGLSLVIEDKGSGQKPYSIPMEVEKIINEEGEERFVPVIANPEMLNSMINKTDKNKPKSPHTSKSDEKRKARDDTIHENSRDTKKKPEETNSLETNENSLSQVKDASKTLKSTYENLTPPGILLNELNKIKNKLNKDDNISNKILETKLLPKKNNKLTTKETLKRGLLHKQQKKTPFYNNQELRENKSSNKYSTKLLSDLRDKLKNLEKMLG